MTPAQKRGRVLAAMTDRDGNPRSWRAAEEIGYSVFCEELSLREIVAALVWFQRRGYVEHVGVEWKLTEFGLWQSRRHGL